MPIHDWTRVDAGTFRDFHNSWIVHLKESLNCELLPPNFYALSEQLRQRRLTVYHTSGPRIVALVEIVSRENKSGAGAVAEFVRKAEQAIRSGIHLVVLDLFRPGRHDPEGMHAEIVKALEGNPYELPEDGRMTFVSYSAGSPPVSYLERLTVGDELPQVPLFLTPEHYVNLPLAVTYAATYQGMPARWRKVIEG